MINRLVTSTPRTTFSLRYEFKCLLMLSACLTMLASGCQSRRAADVEPELAKETLVRVLDTWKAAGSIEELRKQTPDVVVQEALWSNGGKLVDYQIIGDGRVEDANLFCDVELSVELTPGSPPVKKNFTYVIGTDPVLTVFRVIL